MHLNNRKMTNHPPSPEIRYKTILVFSLKKICVNKIHLLFETILKCIRCLVPSILNNFVVMIISATIRYSQAMEKNDKIEIEVQTQQKQILKSNSQK